MRVKEYIPIFTIYGYNVSVARKFREIRFQEQKVPGQNSRNGKFQEWKIPGMENSRTVNSRKNIFFCEIILRKFQDNFLPGQNFPGFFNSRKRKFPERIFQDSRAIPGVKIQ